MTPTPLLALPFAGDPRLATAAVPNARWLVHCQLWQPQPSDHLTTGEHETAVVVLSGTFDLRAGSTAWPARGTRSTPFAGRPMAVFLPKHTEFHAANGQGEILLVAARQPAAPAAAAGRAQLAQKPLLPLAGSGKAFDPMSGDWRPAESFPTAAESLPPRRMQQLPAGGCTVERVLAPDYKAATLSLDEVVLAPQQTLRLAAVPGRPVADELLVFVRSRGAVRIGAALASGDSAWCVTGPAAIEGLELAAAAEPAYVLLAYAGKGPA
ncbi:MAG: 5-deoxy-glucuronate isomerase [Planctomycetes bacterium]|nr:5-deoxy-glucuronate isomerase [Planctomycetota bacterium]